ncbi:hypothetical protein [Rufibacter sp. LB8]|uniref:hypothetical protein n=1 Tax=Rufibacter sp. LB8 TaxID=2777781 RepID=UPI00178C5149|nr:hypothetical protein [Rufibacter sp. LB8]
MKASLYKLPLLLAACVSFLDVQGQASGSPSPSPEPCPGVSEHRTVTVNGKVYTAVVVGEAAKATVYVNGQGPSAAGQPDIVVVERASAQVPGAYAAEKSKNVNRSFKVSSSDKLSIDNQFGKVEVQTWSKNEISVEVSMISRAETESKAQEILDRLSVRISEDRGGAGISLVTEREPMHVRTATSKSFEINYLVKMPKGNPLKIVNKHGSILLPDYEGATELTMKYGKINTGRLTNRHNKVALEYSSGECVMQYMRAGELLVRYSKLALNGGEDINANTAYSTMSIQKVDNLILESRYDPVFKVGSVNQMSGRGSYTTFIIGNVQESLGMDLKYCSKFEVGSIASNFRKVDLNGGYTSIKLGFADKTNFNFDVNTAYCSGLKVDENLVDYSFREVKNTSAVYKGKYGKSSGKALVTVTNRYGSVSFN